MAQVIGWWSAGITSAVAILKGLESGLDVIPIYFETGSHHPDNARFKFECEKLYGTKIVVARNPKFTDVIQTNRKIAYLNGPAGAGCTRVLKKEVRLNVEKWVPHESQIFGFEYSTREIQRAKRFAEQYPEAKPIFPLIDHEITKPMAIGILESKGIERPAMYRLGYANNNCVGCVKGGMGYWNKIRRDFPEVFAETAKLERELSRTCLTGIYLDQLDPKRGHYPKEIKADCGAYCEIEMFDETDWSDIF